MTPSELERDAWLTARLPLDRHSGPAPRLTKERAALMIEQALDAGLSAAPVRSRARWTWLASAAALLLALTGSAFAARRLWFSEPAVVSAPRTLHAAVAAPAAPSPQASLPAVLEPAPPPAPEPHVFERVRAPASEPDDLLQAANRLRSQGRFAAAADVYRVVYEQHAGSASAYVAEIARASLELELLDNPRHAKLLFSRALHEQPEGALDLEARQGLALALRDLGESAAEARALAGLIAAHPQSPAAKRARERLAELSLPSAVQTAPSASRAASSKAR